GRPSAGAPTGGNPTSTAPRMGRMKSAPWERGDGSSAPLGRKFYHSFRGVRPRAVFPSATFIRTFGAKKPVDEAKHAESDEHLSMVATDCIAGNRGGALSGSFLT